MWRVLLFLSALLWPTLLGQQTLYAAYYPASPGCSLQLAVNQTASTDLKTFTNNGYICDVMLVSATAQNVSLVQGTGTTCGTSTVALVGGTAASIALSANGGFALAPSGGNFIKTTTTAQHLCLLQSGSGNVSGVIGYIDAT